MYHSDATALVQEQAHELSFQDLKKKQRIQVEYEMEDSDDGADGAPPCKWFSGTVVEFSECREFVCVAYDDRFQDWICAAHPLRFVDCEPKQKLGPFIQACYAFLLLFVF